MIKIIVAFVVVFGLFYFGITAVRYQMGRDKWSVIKSTLYSLMCAVLTVATLSVIVITF